MSRGAITIGAARHEDAEGTVYWTVASRPDGAPPRADRALAREHADGRSTPPRWPPTTSLGPQVSSEARTKFKTQELVSGSHELVPDQPQAIRFGVMYSNPAVDDSLKVRQRSTRPGAHAPLTSVGR